MRITLDTNVLVSAFIAKHGHPALLLELAVTLEGIPLVLSEPILKELEDVLSRDEVRGRFTYAAKDIREIVRSITRSAEILRPKSKFKTVKEDPKDDVVLNTAHDGNADYIVSGDNHLLKLRKFRGIRIVNPREMIDILGRSFSELIYDF